MNLENMTRLRDHMASLPPESIDMHTWGNSGPSQCGTVACIAGWACVLSGAARDGTSLERMEVYEIKARARNWLGLSTTTASYLFLYQFYGTYPAGMTEKDRVVAELTDMINNKEDWGDAEED